MLTKIYGFGIVDQDVKGFYLRRTLSDQCPFLYGSLNGWACRLQGVKPLACKLWPFRIRGTPLSSREEDAHFKYKKRDFYIYAYTRCPGLVLGRPSRSLSRKILPEFLNIRLGLQRKQRYSTWKLTTLRGGI